MLTGSPSETNVSPPRPSLAACRIQKHGFRNGHEVSRGTGSVPEAVRLFGSAPEQTQNAAGCWPATLPKRTFMKRVTLLRDKSWTKHFSQSFGTTHEIPDSRLVG
jgi:hypothetical protein